MWSNLDQNHQRNDNNNKCILCNLPFNNDASLRKHFEMHTPQGVSSINNEKTSVKNNSGEDGENGRGRMITDSSGSSSINQFKTRLETAMSGANSVAESNNQQNFNQHHIDLLTLQQTLNAQQQAARVQTSRLHQGGIPPGVMTVNPHQHNLINNFGGGTNGIQLPPQLVQQILLARAAAAVNPQLLSNVGSINPAVAAANPYSYLMSAAANFSPFYLSLNNILSAGSGLLTNEANTLLLPQNLNSPQSFCEPLTVGIMDAKRQSVNNNPANVHQSAKNEPNSAMSTPNSYVSSSVDSSTLGSPNERPNRMQVSAIMSPEEMAQRISRLIAQNEAVLEPSPVLTKRRPYTRQHGSLDYTTAAVSSPHRSLTTGRGIRSQSLIETSSPPVILPHQQTLLSSTPTAPSDNNQPSLGTVGSSAQQIPSMNVLNFHAQVESATLQAMNKLYNCKFCDLGVRHLDELKRHEEKCARREECNSNASNLTGSSTTTTIPFCTITKPATPSVPTSSTNVEIRFPLKKRISAAAKAAFDASNAKPSNETLQNSSVSKLEAISESEEKKPIPSISSSFDVVNQPKLIQRNNCPVNAPYVVVDAPRFVASDPRMNLVPKVSLSSSEQLGILHPYCVTVKVPGAICLEPTRAGRKAHQVTQPTNSSSLRRITPSLDSKNCEYSSWSQIAVSPLESKLNIMMMDGCTMRSQRPYLNYTVAEKDLNLMRMTHSSYWTYSKKLLQFTSSIPLVQQSSPISVEMGQTSPTIDICMDSSISQTEISPGREFVSSSSSSIQNLPESETIIEPIVIVSTLNAVCTSANSSTTTTSSAASLSLSKELLKNILISNNHHAVKKVTVCNGGYKTNEAYTYVRGRGRGRYVCARCGIRCKKPSMLKKHIRTHLNVRPYSCSQCMFSFKTKGNLTKHLKSKSHSKKCATVQPNDDSNEFRTEQTGTAEEDTDETLSEDEFETMSDDEMDVMDQQVWQHGTDPTNELRQRTFSFKNVWNRVRTGLYFERQVRTPPLNCLSPVDESWDRCDSAPPSLAIEANVFDFCTKEAKNSTISDQKQISNGKTDDSTSNYIENSSKIYINSLSEGKTQCEICGKEFVKLGLLRLHMAAHMFEQSSRRYDYKCSFCNSCFRSKNLLQKHLLHAHPQQNVSNSSTTTLLSINSRTKSPSQSMSSSTTSCQQNLISPSSSNPRPFECNDCNIAFRIHGHLAKHLRSKSHIMKLECLEKIPIGTFAKLEESNCDYFADIDTSDSLNSLKSLLKLAQRLINDDDCDVQQQRPSSQNGLIRQKTLPNPQHPSPVSLVCTEELRPSPPPSCAVNVITSANYQKNCDKKLLPSEMNGSSTKTVVADVWIPPKEIQNDKQLNNFKEPSTSSEISSFGPIQQSDIVANSSIDTQKTNVAELKCKFCSALFPSLPELDLHWHADHIFMRDGKNFKCPKLNCDTVYPSKRDLRTHLASHYNGTLDSDMNFGSCSDVSRATVVALSKKIATSAGCNNNNNSLNSPETPLDGTNSMKFCDKMSKSNLVKLKFTKSDVISSAASADNSPISDSDASRASVSSQSLSPNGDAYANRQSLKRHSLEDFANSKIPTPSKRLAFCGDDNQHRSSSRNTITPVATPNSHHNPNPSPVAIPVPIVPQRPNAAMPSVWTSFLNSSPSSPQSAYMSAGHNPAASLMGLQQHPAIMAAIQQNVKLFSNGVWPQNFTNANPAIQLLAMASPHLLTGFQNSSSPGNFVQESVFSIDHLRCIMCQKQCYTPMSLQEHLMSHNQPRLHVCKFCDAAFTTAQSLQAHTPCRMQKS